MVQEALGKGIKSGELSFTAFNACMKLSKYQAAIDFLNLIENEEREQNLMALKCVEAIALMEQRDFGKSIEILVEIINNDLRNEIGYVAHIVLICAYFRNEEVEKALRTFSDIPLDMEQNDFLLMLHPIGIFDCEKFYTEAMETVLQNSSDQKNIAMARGFRALYLYGKLSEAESSIDRKDISHIELNSIESDLRSVVEQFPDNINFNRTLGEILYRTSDWFGSSRYLIKAQIISDDDEYIYISALEKIYGNKHRVKKFFSLIDELLEGFSLYERRFSKYILPKIISFLFEKKDYQTIIDFIGKFDKDYWVKEKVLFDVAYSYSALDDKKMAKKYYEEYLNTVGENKAVLNNLAIIYSEEGNFSDAERLYARAVELGADYAVKNLENLNQKRQYVENEKQAVQRAVMLYAHDDNVIRSVVANIYKNRLDNDLILFKSSLITKYRDIDPELFLQNMIKKKYFEIVDDNNLPSEGLVLRINPLLIDQIQKVLRDEQFHKLFEDISMSISADNLMEKYSYDEKLISKLSVLHSHELRIILDRDLMEAALSLATQSYKAAIILSGSIVEAILLDRLTLQKDLAIETLRRIRQKQNKPLGDKDRKIEGWDLESLLDVAFEMKIVSYNLFYWGNGIRGFRNLVHPGVEKRRGKELSVSKENAEIAWSIVKRLLEEIQ